MWLLLPQALSSRLRCKAIARVGHGSGGAAAAEWPTSEARALRHRVYFCAAFLVKISQTAR
jgi:hypothetical protein